MWRIKKLRKGRKYMKWLAQGWKRLKSGLSSRAQLRLNLGLESIALDSLISGSEIT